MSATDEHLREHEHELVQRFTDALSASSGLEFTGPDYGVDFVALDGQHRLDALIHLKDDKGTVLAIECKRTAFPRDVKAALWELDEFARQAEKSNVPVVRVLLAERLSAGAREALRHRGVAFYDESGTLFFQHGSITIDIDREPVAEKRAQPGSPFVGAREQVVHALLHMGDRSFTGQELALLAQTSAYTVSQTLQLLQHMGWVEGDAGGRGAQRRLSTPGALLDAWAESWKARQEATSTWFFFTGNKKNLPDQVASRLQGATDSDWAFTGASAGNALAPLLTNVDRVQVMAPVGAAAELASSTNLSRADEGSNVTLVERGGAALMFRRRLPESDITVASPFIVYLDLLKDERGRNKELANELRQRVLKV